MLSIRNNRRTPSINADRTMRLAPLAAAVALSLGFATGDMTAANAQGTGGVSAEVTVLANAIRAAIGGAGSGAATPQSVAGQIVASVCKAPPSPAVLGAALAQVAAGASPKVRAAVAQARASLLKGSGGKSGGGKVNCQGTETNNPVGQANQLRVGSNYTVG